MAPRLRQRSTRRRGITRRRGKLYNKVIGILAKYIASLASLQGKVLLENRVIKYRIIGSRSLRNLPLFKVLPYLLNILLPGSFRLLNYIFKSLLRLLLYSLDSGFYLLYRYPPFLLRRYYLLPLLRSSILLLLLLKVLPYYYSPFTYYSFLQGVLLLDLLP